MEIFFLFVLFSFTDSQSLQISYKVEINKIGWITWDAFGGTLCYFQKGVQVLCDMQNRCNNFVSATSVLFYIQ